jgi:hypothetical protein
VRPFPLRVYQRMVQESMQRYAQPKTKKDRQKVKAERDNWLGERLLGYLLDLCLDLDLEPWEPTIKRLEKYTGPYPEDPWERRGQFLTDYALGKGSEYTDLLVMALKLGG